MDADSVRGMILSGVGIALAVIAVVGVVVIGSRVWSPLRVVALAFGIGCLWLLPAGPLWMCVAAYMVRNRAEEAMRSAAAKRWHAEHGSSS